MPYAKVKPVINLSVRGLCVKPYYNHSKGCPNWNKKVGCPPQAKLLYDILDFQKPIYCIYNIFDFASHINKMKNNHPDWSERQLECCLYWQGTARKQLKNEIKKFLKEHDDDMVIISCPEACGVDITATMKTIGEELEWPPVILTYQVALAGIPI